MSFCAFISAFCSVLKLVKFAVISFIDWDLSLCVALSIIQRSRNLHSPLHFYNTVMDATSASPGRAPTPLAHMHHVAATTATTTPLTTTEAPDLELPPRPFYVTLSRHVHTVHCRHLINLSAPTHPSHLPPTRLAGL